MKKYDVVALGDVNMDYVVAHDLTFPFSSLVQNGLIHWEEIVEIPGGSGLNFCFFAVEAGYSCLMLGKTGIDSAGVSVTQWLKKQRIEIPLNWSSNLPTGKALIMRDSADIRLLINNKNNANNELSTVDIDAAQKSISDCRVLYISGYCIKDSEAMRYQATLQAMATAKVALNAPTIVFDVVPHRIYEKISFEQFRGCTRDVDILISEVATMRRFLGLGNKLEKIDVAMAITTVEVLSAYYPRLILRFGQSGCDDEILSDKQTCRILHRETGHNDATDKRGFGDKLTLCALRDFYHVL